MFATQAEAIREARLHIWGDAPLAKREWHGPKGEYSVNVQIGHLNVPHIVVAANVNGRLFVFEFDQYGREQGKGFRKLLGKVQA